MQLLPKDLNWELLAREDVCVLTEVPTSSSPTAVYSDIMGRVIYIINFFFKAARLSQTKLCSSQLLHLNQ